MIKLEKTEFLIADHKLSEFSEKQEQFWDILFRKNLPKKPVENAVIDYSKFDDLKSNLWGGELIYDKTGTFCNFELRLVGPVLLEHYGQQKGQYLIDNYSKNSFRNSSPTYHYRFTRLMEELIEKRKPLLTISHYLENNSKEIGAAGLVVPITNDGKNIHTIIGYTEISINELKSYAT